MSELTPIEQGLLLLYASLYLVAFRDAMKWAINWGAFEARSFSLFLSKLPYSFAILILLPVVAFFFLSAMVATVSKQVIEGTREVVQLFVLGGLLCVAILFPWASLHLWSSLARRKVYMGRNEGQPGCGWLNSLVSPDDLPLPRYSYQLLAAFTVSIVIYLAAYWPLDSPRFPYRADLWRQLFIILYVSQLIVLFHIGRIRGFFTHDPKWLLSLRMLGTGLHTVVLPLVVGILSVPIASSLDAGKTSWWWLLLLLPMLGFPQFCSQSTLLVARYRGWKAEGTSGRMPSPRPEIEEGDPRWWWLCLAAEGACIGALFILWRLGIFRWELRLGT